TARSRKKAATDSVQVLSMIRVAAQVFQVCAPHRQPMPKLPDRSAEGKDNHGVLSLLMAILCTDPPMNMSRRPEIDHPSGCRRRKEDGLRLGFGNFGPLPPGTGEIPEWYPDALGGRKRDKWGLRMDRRGYRGEQTTGV